MFNKVILIGNLTRDVELRYTPSGVAAGNFPLAVNRVYKDNVTGENKQEVLFIDVKVFGRSAEVAHQYLNKGRRVLVEGRLVLDQWVDSFGQKRSKHSVIAERVQFMDSKSEAQNQQKPQQNNQNQAPSNDTDEDKIPF